MFSMYEALLLTRLPLCLCSPYILFSDKLISSHCSWALQILVLNLPEELISSLQTLADTPPQGLGGLDWVGTEGQGIELEGGRGVMSCFNVIFHWLT